jgi:hypothetical protein
MGASLWHIGALEIRVVGIWDAAKKFFEHLLGVSPLAAFKLIEAALDFAT